MFNFLKNKKKIVVFDIGAQKIGAISFRIIDNKPVISDMEYQKNNIYDQIYSDNSCNLSRIIKTVYKKVTNDKENKNLIYCNITDPRVIARRNKSEIKSGKLGVSKKEIRRIFKKCISESKVSGKQLIHSYPLNFLIDEKNFTDQPLNEKCEKLGISCFNLLVDQKAFKNLNSSFKKNKLFVKNYFDSGIASSNAFIRKEEKDNGVINIDIGARTTKIVAYIDKRIAYVKNIQIAGDDVTSDISHGLQISKEAAEHAKIIHGTINLPFNEKIAIDLDSNEEKIINKNILYGIIKPRYDEILEIVRDNVFDDIHTRVGIKSVVLTGGGSKIYGIKDLCESIFNRETRIGQIENSESFFYCKPEFSTLLGMINIVKDERFLNSINTKTDNGYFNILEKLDNWIEESYA